MAVRLPNFLPVKSNTFGKFIASYIFIKWLSIWDLNPRHAAYKAVALPTELMDSNWCREWDSNPH